MPTFRTIKRNLPLSLCIFWLVFCGNAARGDDFADLLTGRSLSSAIPAQMQRTDALHQTVLSQINSVHFNNRTFSLWGGGYGGIGKVGKNEDCDFYGGMVGGELNIGKMFRLGAFYALGKSGLDADSKFGSATVDSDDNSLGAYVKWDSLILSGYSLALGNYTFERYKTGREIFALEDFSSLDEYYTGKSKGSQWGIYYEKGWWYAPMPGLNMNSFFAIQYQNLHAGGFQESGPGALAFRRGDTDFDSLRFYAGVRTTYYVGQILALSVDGAYVYDFLDDKPYTMTSFVDGEESVKIAGRGLGRNWLNLGAGVKFSLGGCVSLMANYNCSWGNSVFHTGMGTLRFDF